jgi:hypothetical protein
MDIKAGSDGTLTQNYSVSFIPLTAIFTRMGQRKTGSLEGSDQKSTMELYCQAIEHAVESWKLVQEISDYETIVGELLFRQ